MQTPIRCFSAAPRAHLFSTARLGGARRGMTSSRVLRTDSESNSRSNSPFGSFGSGPAPPKLPKEEQDIFEALQRQSTGAFSTPRSPPKINQSPDASAADVAQAESTVKSRTDKLSEDAPPSKFQEDFKKIIEARGKGEELHPNVRRGATPEFEGDVNPKTGEVGGPKNEPLRWGAAGEWSYNGRTTDF